MKVRAPAEKNFKRAKVKPGRAKRSRSRIRWKVARHLAAVLLFLYAGYRAVNLVVRAAPLQVGKIVVSGNARLSTAEVEALTRSVSAAGVVAIQRISTPTGGTCWSRRGLPKPVCAGCCRRRSRCASPSGRRWGSAGWAASCT